MIEMSTLRLVVKTKSLSSTKLSLLRGNIIEEEFLFCNALQTIPTGRDVFNMVKSCFQKNHIPMETIGSICTDGAPAMLGNRSGFVSLIRNEVPDVIITHCILHRHALMSRTLPSSLQYIMNSCVKIINFIRGRALNHRLFLIFYSKFDDYVLLFHNGVKWLSG